MKNLLFVICSLFFITAANSQGWGNRISGKGSAVTKTLDLPSFKGISNSINANISINQGNGQSVKVKAQQNIIDNLKLKVEDGILHIGYENSVGKSITPEFDITISELIYAAVTGSGNIEGGGFSGGNMLKLKVTGSGNINMNASASNMEARITGSGNIHAKGSAQAGNIRMTGSGSYKGEGFNLKSAEVKMTGSGSAHVRVTDEISGTITGSGSVIGHGSDPARVKLKITGSGKYKSQSK